MFKRNKLQLAMFHRTFKILSFAFQIPVIYNLPLSKISPGDSRSMKSRLVSNLTDHFGVCVYPQTRNEADRSVYRGLHVQTAPPKREFFLVPRISSRFFILRPFNVSIGRVAGSAWSTHAQPHLDSNYELLSER